MMTFNSIKEWKDYCFNTHEDYVRDIYFRNWIKEKEILIFNRSNIQDKAVNSIHKGIKKAINTIGLHFRLTYKNGKSNLNLRKGRVYGKNVLKEANNLRRQIQRHAAMVLLLDNPILTNDALLKNGEALTYVKEGVTALIFDLSKRETDNFYSKVAMHEIFHLFGLNAHHEETQVDGFNENIECVMKFNAPSPKLCRKCKIGLKSFWKGIEYATKQKFITN